MFFPDPAQSESRRIKRIFLKNGKLPIGKPIDAAQDARCHGCGREIKKGEKCVAVMDFTNLYMDIFDPRVYIVRPRKFQHCKIVYRVFCPSCAEERQGQGWKKDIKDILGKIFSIFN
jgi:hypothetical protein